ncbi:TPA: hypothetical protein DEG21_00905 [Patescibacteria group bacterium]|nr:hypothetical protein [Candidatus Gracilibacteria bacterium]HBY74476.1 hypothetical protein [Candidatus Gracilibacteria bacterium]
MNSSITSLFSHFKIKITLFLEKTQDLISFFISKSSKNLSKIIAKNAISKAKNIISLGISTLYKYHSARYKMAT